MVYSVIPVLVLGALGYMFWRAAARMRRDRVYNERQSTRGRHAFTRFHRARYLLGRAFRPGEEEPRWQAEMRARLDQLSSGRRNTRRPPR
jgi:hypothetical protein